MDGMKIIISFKKDIGYVHASVNRTVERGLSQ